MKHYLTLFLAGLLLSLSSGKIYGQVVSREQYCLAEKGNKVILRNIKDHPGTFMYSYRGPNQYFYYANQYYLNTYKFTLPVVLNQLGSIVYTVKDMKIIGERAVVCGKVSTPIGYTYEMGTGWVLECEEKGYVGWLELNALLTFPATVTCHFTTIENTRDLRSLDVFVGNSDTLMAFIGTSDDNAGDPCLVAMTKNGASINYYVHVVNSPSETFTDVAFTAKQVATVSKFTNEHRSFGIRFGTQDDLFYNNNPNDYQVLNTYFTPGVPSGCNQSDTWHNDDVDIRMVAAQVDDDVVVAHDCWYTNPNDQSDITKWTALYHIDAGYNPPTTNLQEAKFIPDVTDVGDAALVDMVCNLNTGNVMLLNMYQQNSPSTASFTNINTSTWTCDRLKTQSRSAMSMDYLNNNSVWIGGADADSNYLFRFWQSIPHLSHYDESCYDYHAPTMCDMEPRPTLETASTDIVSNSYVLTWSRHFKLEAEIISFKASCSKELLR